MQYPNPFSYKERTNCARFVAIPNYNIMDESIMVAQWDSSLFVLPVARVQFPTTAEHFKGFFPGWSHSANPSWASVAENGSISPQWRHTTCGQRGGRPKSTHGQTVADRMNQFTWSLTLISMRVFTWSVFRQSSLISFWLHFQFTRSKLQLKSAILGNISEGCDQNHVNKMSRLKVGTSAGV